MSAKQHVVEINPAKDTPVTRHHTTNTPVVEFDGAMPSFKHVPKMKLVKGNLVVINHATSTPVTEFDGATSTFKHVAKKSSRRATSSRRDDTTSQWITWSIFPREGSSTGHRDLLCHVTRSSRRLGTRRRGCSYCCKKFT